MIKPDFYQRDYPGAILKDMHTRRSGKGSGRTWKWVLLVLGLGLTAGFVLNASQPGRRVEGCPAGCASQSARSAGPLRVVSLNMLHGFPDFKDLSVRMGLIAQEIRRLDADVVLLQEVPWTVRTGNVAKALAGELGYNYLYYRSEGNKWLIFFEQGEAILSRYPLIDPLFTSLSPRVNLFEMRVALEAVALTPWGPVTFADTHLTDQAPQKNLGEAQSLRSFVEAQPGNLKVVAGDFNAREDSPQIRLLSDVWSDAFRVAHPVETGLTCCIDDLKAAPGEPLEERIDYIFLAGSSGSAGRVISLRKVFDEPFPHGGEWQWASDHVGLMLELGQE
jgi:endonuclease/exonuclease/phosphatase family metal-dependent hydrolase